MNMQEFSLYNSSDPGEETEDGKEKDEKRGVLGPQILGDPNGSNFLGGSETSCGGKVPANPGAE